MAVDIDSLQIEIEATSSDAASKIDQLATALTNLKSVAKGGAGLTTTTKQLQALSNAAKLINGTSLNSQKIQQFASAMNSLSAIQKASGLNSSINALKKLPEISTALDKADLGKFAKQINQVASAMKPLASEMQKVSNGFSAFPIRIQKIIQSNNGLAASNQKAAKSFGLVNAGINLYFLQRVADMMSNWVVSANRYIENVNLFQVSMGEFYDEAFAYTQLVSDRLGIDPSEWMEAQGTFMLMANGFGIAEDQAYQLSKSLTELAYDISSLKNIRPEEAVIKLRSALAGELEPIRALGLSISEATLQEYALSKGITESVSAMTEQEKALLRSVKVLEDSTRIGYVYDFAKTLESPANAMRVLRQQIQQLSVALGTLLLPIIVQILPYFQAFVEVVTEAIRALATLVGFTMPEWDTESWGSGVTVGAEDMTGAMDDATKSAKNLAKATLGIDELNIISPVEQASGVGAGDVSGWAQDLEIPNIWDQEYISQIQTEADKLKEKMREILPLVVTIGAAFLAWKIGDVLFSSLASLSKNLGYILSSIALVVGMAAFLYNAFDAIANGVDFQNLLGMLVGLGIIVGALAIAGHNTAAAIAAIAGGIIIVGISIKDAIETGLNSSNLMGIMAGITIATIGLTAAFGKVGTVIGMVLGAIVLLTTGFNDFINNGVTEYNILAIGAGFAVLAMAVGSVSAPIGILIAIIGALTVGFMLFGDKAFGVMNVVVEGIQNAINWTRNLLEVVFAVFGNISALISNFATGVRDAFFALVENIKIGFSNGFIEIQRVFLTFAETILSGIKTIAEKINSLVGVFGLEIDVSGITNTIDAIAGKKEELQGEKSDYVDIGEAFQSGMSTFEYKDLGEAFNTFDAFESGWVEDAYAQGEAFGASLQDGFRDALGGLRDTIGDAVGGLTESLGFDDLFSGESVAGAFEGMSQSYGTNTDLMKEYNKLFSEDTTSQITNTKTFFEGSLAESAGYNQDFTSEMEKMYRNMASNSNSQIDSIKSNLDSIPRNITTVHTIITERVSGGSSTRAFASGGFPETGQMFIAREAGPELVGTIGNRTAVANNAQIVAGIASGVAEANQSQNALLREQNELLRAILAKEGVTYISDKQIKKAYDRATRSSGATIMSGGVVG